MPVHFRAESAAHMMLTPGQPDLPRSALHGQASVGKGKRSSSARLCNIISTAGAKNELLCFAIASHYLNGECCTTLPAYNPSITNKQVN